MVFQRSQGVEFYIRFLAFVTIAASRMCFSLSAPTLSRYLSVKSSLNRPLNFFRRLFSCDLLMETTEVAISSYERLKAIILISANRNFMFIEIIYARDIVFGKQR